MKEGQLETELAGDEIDRRQKAGEEQRAKLSWITSRGLLHVIFLSLRSPAVNLVSARSKNEKEEGEEAEDYSWRT